MERKTPDVKIDLQQAGRPAVEAVRAIRAMADKEGIRVFLVGGGVRDILLKRPVKDLDIVLEGPAVEFARTFAAQHGIPVKIHRPFGTASLGEWKGVRLDFVTARSETYPHPGALPVVRPGSLEEDIFRRDFTINALAVCLNRGESSRVIDLGGGMADLEKGWIRVFHDKSFLDDPTRVLRAVRFEQRFRFRLGIRTRRLLTEAVLSRAERAVTAPRYFQEFARGFSEEAPGRYLRRLKALGALGFLGDAITVEKPVMDALDEWKAADRKKEALDPSVFYMAALYAGCPAEMLKDQGRVFQWPRIWKKSVLNMVRTMEEADPGAKGSPERVISAFSGVLPGKG